jgi:hypothetical protein
MSSRSFLQPAVLCHGCTTQQERCICVSSMCRSLGCTCCLVVSLLTMQLFVSCQGRAYTAFLCLIHTPLCVHCSSSTLTQHMQCSIVQELSGGWSLCMHPCVPYIEGGISSLSVIQADFTILLGAFVRMNASLRPVLLQQRPGVVWGLPYECILASHLTVAPCKVLF